MGNSFVSTCGGTFFDSRGNNNYNNGENYTMTFCSDNAGQCIRIQFTQFATEANIDELTIYDGPDNTGTVIGVYSGTNSPGTITSVTGCLTFEFTSDLSIRDAGWEATISCVNCTSGNCSQSCNGGPPPVNDDCLGSINIGSLPSPSACPVATGNPVVINASNLCATDESPYTYQTNCSSGGDMASPSADIWYSFTIVGPTLNIDIVGGLQTPEIGLYSGINCSNLAGRGCDIGANGNLHTTIGGLVPGTYWLQISGNGINDRCDFTLTLQNNNDCDGCVIASNLVANPPAVNGTYQAGQTVSFCYTVTDYNQTSNNWLHSVCPTFGPGWNLSTLTSTPPQSCSGTGIWNWYQGPVTSSATNLQSGAGFYYETWEGNFPTYLADNDPGNNFGDDNDLNLCHWSFCWSVQTLPLNQCIPGASLNIDIDTHGDGESGSWISPACGNDINSQFLAQLACCSPPDVNISSVNCATGTASVTATGQGISPWKYVWKNSGGTTIQTSIGVSGSDSIPNLAPGNYSVVVTDNAGCTSTVSIVVAVPAGINSIPSQTNLTCNAVANGIAGIAASGGTPPYTYLWNTSATTATINNLQAGNYTVTATDASGCTATQSITLTQPATLVATITPTNPSCNTSSGSATVNTTGGTPNYTVLWSNGITTPTISNLTAGNYSVTVTDANGCTTTASTVLVQQPLLTVNSVASSNPTCSSPTSGFLTVSPNGGTGPFTYAWSPTGGTAVTASNLTTGTYQVTITDALGCTATFSTMLGSATTLTAAVSNTTPVSCAGSADGSASVAASAGVPGYTYAWSPAGGTLATATNLAGGNYTVTVTDAQGCTMTASAVIVEPAAIAVTITPTAALCNGGATGSAVANPSGGGGTFSYNWSPSGGTLQTASGLAAGNYTVTVTDQSGCTSTASQTITEPNAITSLTSSTPAACGTTNGTATVTPSGGTTPYTYSWSPAGGTSATATNLTGGNYTVIITDAGGCTATASVSVASPGSPSSLVSSSTNVTCAGGTNGSATVAASGGAGTYTYSWSPAGGTLATATGLPAGNYNVTITDASGCSTFSPVIITEPLPLTLSLASSSPASCAGSADGSATFNASGGTSTYSYSWSPAGGTLATATNLAGGNYTVTVTDAQGCTMTASAVIVEPAAIAVTITPTAALCNGGATGSAVANPSGGGGTFSYNWSPSGGTLQTASGLAAGNYTVTVTDQSGCTSTASQTITEPNAITSLTSSTPAACGTTNGTATVTPSGGTTPYTYSWSPAGGTSATATNLTGGNYTVIITDAGGCTATASVSVASPGSPSSLVSSSTNVTCAGGTNGSATVAASGGAGTYTYSWSPAGGTLATATGLPAGNYNVTITDASGCSTFSPVIITEPLPLALSLASSSPASCAGSADGSATFNASGGTSTYSYSWSPSGGTLATATNLAGGNYTVIVTDLNGCTSNQIVNISEPSALNIQSNSVSPLCNGGSDGSVSINVSGGTSGYIYSWTGSSGTTSTISNLSPGTYSVIITDANGCTASSTSVLADPASLLLQTSSTSASCGSSNGTLNANVNGGTGGYSYNWSPAGGTIANPTNLSAGAYTIIVTDANGCTVSGGETISNTGGPVVQASVNADVNCYGGNNGSATANITSGSGPFTYLWQPSGQATATATNLAAGNYSVAISDINGCVSGANITIGQPQQINLLVHAVPALCFGTQTGSLAVSSSGGTGVINYLWSDGSTSMNVSSLSAGVYSVIGTDASGCTSSSSGNVTEPIVLSVQSSTTLSSCTVADGSATVIPSGGTMPYTYSWSSGGTNQTESGLAAGAYTAVVTDANGCTLNSNIVINNAGAPAISIASTTNVVCHGASTGSASVNITGGQSPFSYSWSSGGGNNSSATNLSAGNYTVSVTDANGCSSAIQILISEPSALLLQSSSTDATCGTANGSAEVHPSGGMAPYSFAWTNGAGNDSVTSSLSQGSYSVTVTDGAGCTSAASVNIGSNGGANVILQNSTDASCNGSADGTAIIDATNGTLPYVFYWSPSGGTMASATGLAAGNYSVTVTDGSGCTSLVYVVIDEPDPIDLQTTSSPAACNGGSNGTASVNVSGGNAPYNYLWQTGETSASISGLAVGSYNVIVTDSHGCSEQTFANVNSVTAINIQHSSSDVPCPGAHNGSLSIIVSGGNSPYTYNWNPSIGNDSTADNLSGGNYNVVVTDADGCAGAVNIFIHEPDPFNLIPDSPAAVCIGQAVSISVAVTGGTAPYNYNWSNGISGASQIVFPDSTQNYIVSITDSNGCSSAQDSVDVMVNPPLTANATVPDNVCSGSDVTISGSASGGSGNYFYSWNNGSIISADSIVTINTDTTFILTVSDDCGSPEAQDVVTVTVEQQPLVNFYPAETQGCIPLSVDFVDQSTSPNGALYTWDFGDGTASQEINPSHIYTEAGAFSVGLNILTAGGCSGSYSIPQIIETFAYPVGEFSPSQSISGASGMDVNFINNSTGATSYLWNFGDASEPSFEENPVHHYEPGNYNVLLIVTNEAGCTDTIQGVVQIDDLFSIYIPNAFSPNGDLVNETFTALGEGWNDYEMLILDRWGVPVYHTNDASYPWNGHYSSSGNACQNDVYVYKIYVHDTKNELHTFVGHVTLIK